MPRDERKRQKKLLKKRRKQKAKRKQAHMRQSSAQDARRALRHAREYPISECLVNRDWQDQGLANILIARAQPENRIAFGMFLVDVQCLGVKNCFADADVGMPTFRDEVRAGYIKSNDAVKCPAILAHQVIYGALDYAASLGFKPHKDFALAQHILDERSSIAPNPDLEFGRDGKPFFAAGPSDNVNKILAHLEKTVGEGNFHYLIGGPVSEDGEPYEFYDGDEYYADEEDEFL